MRKRMKTTEQSVISPPGIGKVLIVHFADDITMLIGLLDAKVQTEDNQKMFKFKCGFAYWIHSPYNNCISEGGEGICPG